MALGRPAIATGYSGNRHFMTDENSFLVEYRMTCASGDCGPYPPDARWAEPDLNHAARLMRTVYRYPEEAARRARRGQADLLLHHGIMPSASAIASRLAEIRRTRTVAATEVPAPPPARQPEPVAAFEPPAPATEMVPASDAAMRVAALEAFTAAMPQLRQLGEPRVSHDERSWPWLRRAAQRAMFRAIRPYWFQQQQFQHALLEAVHGTFERLAGSAATEGNGKAPAQEHRPRPDPV
jgi:hypothetical protein